MTSQFARTLLLAVSVVLAALAVDTARADVSQTVLLPGCPAAFELMSVAVLEAQGPYRLARIVDTAGNNDGFVCARRRPDGYAESDCSHGGTIACLLEQLGLPVYHFVDNDNPAEEHAQTVG
jgi:hypothetical protein